MRYQVKLKPSKQNKINPVEKNLSKGPNAQKG